MANFENTLQVASQAILRRKLTDAERIEFLELAGVIGMSSVEDYLYMLMILKRNEDRISAQMDSFKKEIKARLDEIGFLEKKIDTTLGKTLEDMLGKGAEKALVRLSEAVYQKSEGIAARKKSWLYAALLGFCAKHDVNALRDCPQRRIHDGKR